MLPYRAPLNEYEFLLSGILEGPRDAETELAILAEADRFAREQLLPLNASGDETGARLENDSVKTPPGFAAAYRAYVDGGWPSLACAEKHGGQGLGTPVKFAFGEIINACNMSFSLAPLLTTGVYHALSAHGADELQQSYLPKLVSGEWPGTMCLTEPQAGTDLSLLKTRATAQGNETFKITGTKIFITYGDHDLSENIVHLVLARLPDAPAGVKGISLFLCPKILPDGTRNTVKCSAIEKKMGIHASPTCVMNFDGATAWLVGQPHNGLACMFTMMNDARLMVGIQGLAIAEASYQAALAYAQSRQQMRAAGGAKNPQTPADPIIVHPDVRRMLLMMRSKTEACRALAFWVGDQLDKSRTSPDAAQRQRADDLVSLLTPVVKSVLTDHGFAAANHAIQIHGGHGYIRGNGVEQLARDARIAQLYEGTNGIQALDLAGRKRSLHEGRLVRTYFDELAAVEKRIAANPAMKDVAAPFQQAVATLQAATATLNERAANPVEPASAATDYLNLFGLVSLCHMWILMLEKAVGFSGKLHQDKMLTARFFLDHILPEVDVYASRIKAGSNALMMIDL